jgi:ATP-dependent DNA ligase
VKENASFEVLKVEFRRATERITEKYFLLFSLHELDKSQFNAEEFEERAQVLRDQYKEDLAVLAVAIDQSRGTEEL